MRSRITAAHFLLGDFLMFETWRRPIVLLLNSGVHDACLDNTLDDYVASAHRLAQTLKRWVVCV